MSIKRASVATVVRLCVASALIQISGCNSTPKPMEADGRTRVPANDPARVQALQARVSADRQLLTENNQLRAQLDALQARLNEMANIVRDALLLPPERREQPGSPSTLDMQSVPPIASSASVLPTHAYSATAQGAVIRVFYRFGRTEFEPSEAVVQSLRSVMHGATLVEVRGHTDSNTANPVDRWIAMQRAEKARSWLVNNGVDEARIRTMYFTAGAFLAENKTAQGRALNRRVEIEAYRDRSGVRQMASNS